MSKILHDKPTQVTRERFVTTTKKLNILDIDSIEKKVKLLRDTFPEVFKNGLEHCTTLQVKIHTTNAIHTISDKRLKKNWTACKKKEPLNVFFFLIGQHQL